ncbi:MAG TPA: hypothetical protein ACFCUY_18780 [Xenococcaceae cyanobacterium]
MGKNDFFLEPDDAQTLGDISYMRKSVRVRRTFPKTLKNKDGFAVEKQVSAMEDVSFSDSNGGFKSQTNNFSNNGTNSANSEVNNASFSGNSSFSQPTPSSEQRRKTDTTMDTFLNMARNIRKKR